MLGVGFKAEANKHHSWLIFESTKLFKVILKYFMCNCHLIRLVFAVVVVHEIQASTFHLSGSFRFKEILLAFGSKIKANPQVFYKDILQLTCSKITSLQFTLCELALTWASDFILFFVWYSYFKQYLYEFCQQHVRLCTTTSPSIFVTEDKIGAVKWLQNCPNLSVRSRAWFRGITLSRLCM